MERFLFFNSTPEDRRIWVASDFADYFGSILSSGLIHTNKEPGLRAEVEAGTLNTIISAGKAVIEGHLYENTTPLTLKHNIPEASLDRIDRIVLRLDLRNQSRFIKLFVSEGMPAAQPAAPTLQRDQFIYELSLAQVRVRANTVQLLPSDLTDERLNEAVCGLAQSLISLPTERFQEQWDAFMASVNDEGYATLAMLNDVDADLQGHKNNAAVHKTSQQIRSESTTELRTEVVNSLPASPQLGRIVFHNDTVRTPKFKGYDGGKWV